MDCRLALLISLSSLIFLLVSGAKSVDPYKVLGVERSATQREIQKAFHKLSLQYHPDKNKSKGAQEKFSEINNAYDILSDEEKRRNYDTYGDEKGQPGFHAGHPGGQGGHTFFTGGQQGQNQYFRSPDWQNMAGQGGSQSYSFSFGGFGGDSNFDFGFGDVFSSLFGGGGGKSKHSHFGSSNGGDRTQSGFGSSSKSIKAVSSQVYKSEIVGKGMSWLLYSYKKSSEGFQNVESIVLDVATSLDGALQVGSLDCGVEQSLCKELGVSSVPRVYVYSLRANGKSSLVEYADELSVKKLKAFCQDHLPRLSNRLELKQFEFSSPVDENLPTVLLLSTKKDTPTIWRVVSGLYHNRFVFYDVQVSDVSDPTLKKLGVDTLPAVIGWLSNGEKHILKKAITVQDLKSGVHDLSTLLDGFEKKNKKVASTKTQKEKTSSWENQVPLLVASNFDAACGEAAPVCIIGAFRSSKAKEKLESILKMVSQKTLSRKQNSAFGSRDSVSYSLLDATKQTAFLTALEKSGFKSVDKFLVAYKPRKGKFATFQNAMTVEEVEGFISSVLNGDVRFTKTRQKPVLK